MARRKNAHLPGLGVYGFDSLEPLILSALVTEDPLLLIGPSGTGKTYLLNSLSEALGLEHRHYNASLISFDDLVGFPYPDDEKTTVRFLKTPATVWGAESVLIDEINRCKPEHQNRLFSLVHERKVQGLSLDALRYRWAAMNPCGADQSPDQDYLGAEPLDAALADRFALILDVGDWDALTDADRRLVAAPAGEGAIANDNGRLKAALAGWRQTFVDYLDRCPARVVDYVCAVTTALLEGGIRVSPRRTRLITRTLLAALVVEGLDPDAPAGRPCDVLFKKVLDASLPQRAGGHAPSADKVAAAHRLAWFAAMAQGPDKFLHYFHLERHLDRKAQLLMNGCPDADTGTLAVEQLLAQESKARAAAFALAAYPAASAKRLPVGAEGVNDLGRLAQDLLTVDGEMRWQEALKESNTTHPELVAYAPLLAGLEPARQARARQLLYFCIVRDLKIADPRALEEEFDRCVRVFAGAAAA
jgi:MoxR-like ATPase